MREVCVNGCVDLDGAGSGSPVHRPELEKVKHSYTDIIITNIIFIHLYLLFIYIYIPCIHEATNEGVTVNFPLV